MAKPNNYNLPNRPGIYIFKDGGDSVLYIGKAKNLKKRVASYFAKNHSDRPWTNVMVALIKDTETIVVSNEVEALMLEATLIKKHMPRFNIMLTDDKSYPYIKLVTDELYPRFQVVRQHLKDGAKYFGPFLSARMARLTVEFLRKLYGVHLASKPIKSNHDRPCLNCQLEHNLCPLTGAITPEQYGLAVNQAVDFLQGKRKTLIKDVKTRMAQAAKGQNFELAAKLRDQLLALRRAVDRQEVISTQLEDYDAVGAAQAGPVVVLAVLRVREGRLTGQNHFFFKTEQAQSSREVIRQFLISTYYNFAALPPLVALPQAIEDQSLIEQWLKQVRGGAFTLRPALRGAKRDLVRLAAKNAQAKLEARLLRSDQATVGLVALQELLKLDRLPNRIEAVDISNLGASEAVGATVCFVGGIPDKNEYRRYKIKFVTGPNDLAMIKEITARRFADTTRPVPDLFVIDGGPEQLKAALSGLGGALRSLKQVIALAKKPDRVFLPGRKLPLPNTGGNKGLLLLSRIRDEVHRFGIQFQRTRQRKRSLHQ